MATRSFQYACLLLLLLAGSYSTIKAQDTLRITLPDAEKLFINKNLQLLAQKYNLDIAKAQVIQAKLYNNPNLQFTGNIFNPDSKKYFDVSNSTGEYILGIQQLITLAGKRNKQVKLAQTNVTLAENSFFDLLRTLRFTLRSDFYNIYFLQNSLNAYTAQILSLEKLNTSYEELLKRGVVTLKDAVRIKALLYSLKAEQTNLQNQVNEVQGEMRMMLQNDKIYVLPLTDTNKNISAIIHQINFSSLLDTAYANRYDLKLAQTTLLYNEQNYSLQKAMRTPDLSLGASFDKRGSFVQNASFFSMAIDLPFFNKNQGNIKAAKISIDQSKTQFEQARFKVENEVQTAYTKAINTDKMLQAVDVRFRDQFEQLLQGITENFQKKNISLIDFTDFYDSYKANILQINLVQNDRLQAIEALNFAIGKTIID